MCGGGEGKKWEVEGWGGGGEWEWDYKARPNELEKWRAIASNSYREDGTR